MRRTAFLAPLAVALGACGTMTTHQVSVPVPIECRVQQPQRPAMPTDSLGLGVDVDRWVQAAQAELLLREAYEDELQIALLSCLAPDH